LAKIVITGASGGIGAAAAVELTRQGHEVLATGRSDSKLAEVRKRMASAAAPGQTVPEPVVADLSSLAAVNVLADDITARWSSIDVLANNAAVSPTRREMSADGYEMMLAVNHLAPFLLTHRLLEPLRAAGGRVVTTSSGAHRVGSIDFDDLQMERSFRPFRAYGRSKLANIWFTSELTSRTGLPASSYHPGAVNTDLGRSSRLASLAKPLMGVLTRTPAKGADTLVWLATDPEGGAPRAAYYYDRKPGRMSARAHDTSGAVRLWDVSAELVGI
jgi:NAD(P)-dependent dehydrogenase (short-subunit alcohol dehydrogenase family)